MRVCDRTAALGAVNTAAEAQVRIDHLKTALRDTPGAPPQLGDDFRALEARLKDLQVALSGDGTVARRNEPTPASLVDRVQQVVGGRWGTSSDATATGRRNYESAAAAFGDVLEEAAESAGAPWTPGRLPTWRPE